MPVGGEGRRPIGVDSAKFSLDPVDRRAFAGDNCRGPLINSNLTNQLDAFPF